MLATQSLLNSTDFCTVGEEENVFEWRRAARRVSVEETYPGKHVVSHCLPLTRCFSHITHRHESVLKASRRSRSGYPACTKRAATL